jgi:hypothetical protein
MTVAKVPGAISRLPHGTAWPEWPAKWPAERLAGGQRGGRRRKAVPARRFRALGAGRARCVWHSGVVTESEPGRTLPGGGGVSSDVLAARLLAAHRILAALNADSDVRIRLHLRLMAICTSLKMPGASTARGIERLDRLMADAHEARGRYPGRSE